MDREQIKGITVSKSLNLKDYIVEKVDRSFTHFVDAYNGVDIERLTDDELGRYGALCEDGYGEYLREKRRREG